MQRRTGSKLLSLPTLFVIIALVEAFYGAAGLLIPPSQVAHLLGWNLTADGQWVTKLLGAALATQAATAWVLRRDPPVPMAFVLGFYQIGASMVDVMMWLTLADQGIFANPLARWSVITAIPTHFVIGVLVLIAAARHKQEMMHA